MTGGEKKSRSGVLGRDDYLKRSPYTIVGVSVSGRICGAVTGHVSVRSHKETSQAFEGPGSPTQTRNEVQE